MSICIAHPDGEGFQPATGCNYPSVTRAKTKKISPLIGEGATDERAVAGPLQGGIDRQVK
jgi:hypothetical protein